VYAIENDETRKTLTLAYGFLGNDFFVPRVINDSAVAGIDPWYGLAGYDPLCKMKPCRFF
jgi:hypothetical protein